MTHKRNGKEAKARRQKAALVRETMLEDHLRYVRSVDPAEGLLHKIFGKWETCMECQGEFLLGSDCQTPHCKALREEKSKFYDEITDDHIQINGHKMYSGLDY